MFVDITAGCKLGRIGSINSSMENVEVSVDNNSREIRNVVSGGKSSDGRTVAVAKPMEVIEAAARVLIVMLVVMTK